MKIRNINFFKDMRVEAKFYCPECNQRLKAAYMVNTVWCCLKCQATYQLKWHKLKTTIDDVKKDGWLK